MLPLLRSLTFRYLLQKWDRSLLVALSIALGVATLVSARLLNQCTEEAVLDTTVPADVADLYVDNGEAGVPLAIADELRRAKVPGVNRVEPVSSFSVRLPELGTRTARLLGAQISGWSSAAATSAEKLRIKLTILNLFVAKDRPILLSRRLYEERKALGKTDADPVLIRYTTSTQQFNLLGVIDVAKDSPVAPYADSMVAVDIGDASRLMNPPGPDGRFVGRVTRLDLFLENSAELDEVKHRVAAIMGERAQVLTPQEIRKSTTELIGGLKLVLNLCSVGALVVGLFLVYNALSVTVAERRHDIGVMRSLGATRTQIARLFTIEAMILGLLGSLPGIPLGIGLARMTISLFGEELKSVFQGEGLFQPVLSLQTALVAIAAGLVTALFAALVPALQAASDEPADAVRRAPSKPARLVRYSHRSACFVLVLAGLTTVFLRDQLPSRIGSLVGMTLVLVGLFLAMPIFVRILAALLHPLCRSLLGVEARLAADNLIRSPARTGVVIGALAAGVCLMTLTAGIGKSNNVPIREWLDQVIRADAYVFRGNLASANSSINPMESSDRSELAKVPGVDRVVGLRFYRPKYSQKDIETYILMIAIDAHDYYTGIRARQPEGLPKLDLFDRLPEGHHTLVSENFAARWGVKEGDTITVPSLRGQKIELKVIGIGQDYSWNQGTIFVDRTIYKELFDDSLVDAYHVFFDLKADHDTTYEAVRKHADSKEILVQNRESVYVYLVSVIDRMMSVAYMQQLIVAIVASLGVVTALLISVLQRRRELGLLRAVGATQGQILKTVLAEAMLMGFLGTILGFALGLPLEWYMLDVVILEETGFVFEMLIPWKQALGIGAISILMATLAGLWPAIHAVRMPITDAIAYE
ncbi:MAG: FtsX-like permease family protein [Gemmataceae bacterium]|nr:FtsX-like permease family protein [Gemmataceae bacterium]